MKLYQRIRHITNKDQRGFTFVEIAIIAPIVILFIGAFITVIVSITGEVIASRSSTQMLYNIQDALNQIDQDVKLSSTFLAQTNITLQSPQGYGDDTTAFTNVDSVKGPMLILNSLATTGNPLSSSSSIAYLSNTPNACGALQGQNTPLSVNVVYFVKNNTLWRRTITPLNYWSVACNATGTGTAAPWQQPSCTAVNTSNRYCETQDEDLVDNVSASGLTIQYFNGSSGGTVENTAASANPSCNTTACIATRNAALLSATTVNIGIDAQQTVAGKNIEQTGSIRSTRLDTNASAIASAVAPTIPSTPAVTGKTPNIYGTTSTSTNIPQTIFSWSASTGGGTIKYTIQYQINGGTMQTVPNISNSAAPSYTIPNATFGNVITAQVEATNTAGTSAWSSTATVNVPIWAVPQLQTSWQNYVAGNGYSGSPYETAGFTRSSAGLVSLKGLVANGTGTIMTLPVGYRPTSDLLFIVVAGSNTAAGRLDILPDGTVTLEVGSTGYVSLDNVRFMPAPPDGPTFTGFTPLAGWVAYSAPTYAAPSYNVDSVGRVEVEGLIKNGTTTGGTPIWTFPTALKPAESNYLPEDSNNAYGDVSLTAANYEVVTDSNAFFSIQAIYYPSGAATWTNLTLNSPWAAYGGGYEVPAYTKASDGIVMIKGFVRSGAVSTTIATLPVGYRPKQEAIYAIASYDALGRIDVFPNGNIYMVASTNTGWVSLAGINFPAEQ